MKNIIYKVFTVLGFIASAFFISCSEDPTPSLYELPAHDLPAPVISSLSPAQEALAGVTKITITGSNFLTTTEYNRVYFNNVPGTVLSSTPTSLVVVPPVVISDTVTVRISVVGSEFFSNSVENYMLKPAVSEFYPFDAKIKGEIPYGICADNLENVYVSLSGLGTKVITNGVLNNFSPKGAETFFRAITFASDNAIYAVRGGVRGVYRLVQGTAPVAFVSTSQGITDNVNDVEFDKTRNVIWGGGATGIVYRIRLDKNVKKFNINGVINAMRVAGDNLFIACRVDDSKEIVWKLPIISADSVGTAEEYFNFSEQVDPTLRIADIVLSADGDLYIGTNKTKDPIYVVHPDKSFEVTYPGLISSAVYSLTWGSGINLYMTNIVNDVNKTILRINLEKPGAN
jgi:hypothetical protein